MLAADVRNGGEGADLYTQHADQSGQGEEYEMDIFAEVLYERQLMASSLLRKCHHYNRK